MPLQLHLEAPPRHTRLTGKVLAIESNVVRANTLKELLRDHVQVDLAIVPTVTDAIRSIDERVPDLVITSTFLAPSDEATLIGHLKERPGGAHVQVIIVPHFTSQDATTPHDRPRSFRLWRHSSVGGAGCDLTALREQIAAYLEQARAGSIVIDEPSPRAVPAEMVVPDGPALIKPALRLVHPPEEIDVEAAANSLVRRFPQAVDDQARDRRRAPRLPIAQLPWLWSARFSSGPEAKLVDVSDSGVLVETAAKIALGSTVDLRLIGQDTDLSIPARVLRSAVSEVNPLGVRYHVAAAFARELHLMALAPKRVPATSGAVANVGRRELESVLCGLAGSAARVRFEQELRRHLAVRDVLIRRSPVTADDGAESVYFSIPGGSGLILQVIFERDHEPSATEFEVLKAAARLAVAVLERESSRDVADSSAEALAG